MKKDWNRRFRRFNLRLRRARITLVGDEGKPWRRRIFLAAGAVVLLTVALLSRAEPQLMNTAEVHTVQERGTLRVGVRYDVEGLAGAADGLEHELARLLARRILPEAEEGTAVTFIEVNAMTFGSKLDDGSIDVALALCAPSGAAQYSYSTPYFSDPCVLVAAEGAPTFTLQNMQVGVVQSNPVRKSPEFLLLEAYRTAHPDLGLEARPYAAYPDMLLALGRGEVTAALLPGQYFSKYAQSYPITASAFSLGSIDYAVCCASDTSVFADIATLLIDELRMSGELAQLMRKYGVG